MSRISFTPDPAVAGGTLVICFDFDGLSETQVKLGLDWFPDEISDEERTVTPSDDCVSVAVPASATSLTVTDETAGTPANSVAIQPPDNDTE